MREYDIQIKYREIHGETTAGHEPINRRFKQCSTTKTVLKHSLYQHANALHVIVNLTNVSPK